MRRESSNPTEVARDHPKSDHGLTRTELTQKPRDIPKVKMKCGSEQGDTHLAENIERLVCLNPFLEERWLTTFFTVRWFKRIFSVFDLAFSFGERERGFIVKVSNELGPDLEEKENVHFDCWRERQAVRPAS
jgi:hypothetical protein